MNLTRISTRLESGARSFVSTLAKSDAFLPVILLEAAVTGGRTYYAYKRGGFVEARERGTEETFGAIFWLGGVAAFSKIGDIIGKKLLGLDNIDFPVPNGGKKRKLGLEKIEFDTGKDAVRDPMRNYIRILEQQSKTTLKAGTKAPIHSPKTIAAFKFTKIITSILLANAVIGFVLPKINQAITRKYLRSAKLKDKQSQQPQQLQNGSENFDTFINKENTKKPSFKGDATQTLLSLTNVFENSAACKLLSTDVGIAGGRAYNARNKDERREILFRDLSSIYFYLLCRSHINSALNKVESGRWTRLNPVTADQLNARLKAGLKGTSLNADDFEKLVFGDTKAQIPANIQAKFDGKEIISLKEFKALIGNNADLAKRADLMSKIQPELEGVAILTKDQVKDLYTNGLIDNPKFLSRVFEKYTGGNSVNPMKYVSDKSLRALKQEMVEYAQDIIKNSRKTGDMVSVKMLKRFKSANLIKNGINLIAGYAVCAYFLSTVIPKVQYWITIRKTGENKFPGIKQLQ